MGVVAVSGVMKFENRLEWGRNELHQGYEVQNLVRVGGGMNFIWGMKFKNRLEWERNEVHRGNEVQNSARAWSKKSS